MTEEVWLTYADPKSMLEHLGESASSRKMRLLIVACGRRFLHLMTDPRSVRAVHVGELFADGRITDGERQVAFMDAKAVTPGDDPEIPPEWDERTIAEFVSGYLAQTPALPVAEYGWAIEALGETHDIEYYCTFGPPATYCSWHPKLIRDIFGNPFRSVTVDPRWFSSTSVALAQSIYEERAFDRLPILADALEEAGCDNLDLLSHCRGDGPHVRGCWVIDLLLGKG